ncbi:hypothetical protein [Brevibacillus invocatus]|nr:hypothetical protein [Brevibacillus invocatus]
MMQDYDYLVKMFNSTDDKGAGHDFDLQHQPGSQDYKAVLKAFVQHELKKEIRSFITVSHSVNPRTMLVTTTDGTAIEVRMQKLNNLDHIWRVTGSNWMTPTGYASADERYRMLQIEEAPVQVREWATQWMASSDWEKHYLLLGEKTYVLIKTSESNTDSVELQDLGFWAGELSVSFQTFDYSKTADPSLISDYLLLEVDYAAEHGVSFRESYSYRE